MQQSTVSVPSFGDSFFIRPAAHIKGGNYIVVSVPSFGDSFFISSCGDFGERYDVVSVPSFGDSFFIVTEGGSFILTAFEFPSPHSGILFLYIADKIFNIIENGFRPLIRGFFFYPIAMRVHDKERHSFRPLIRGFFFYTYQKSIKRTWGEVSVPSFGDSFFITTLLHLQHIQERHVSVPSFGDSFFMVRKMKHLNLILVHGFRPLIRGFFFYRQCPKSVYVPVLPVSVPSFGDSFFMHSAAF